MLQALMFLLGAMGPTTTQISGDHTKIDGSSTLRLRFAYLCPPVRYA